MSERNDSADPPEAKDVRQARGGEHVALRRTLHAVLAVALVVYFTVAVLLIGLRYVLLPHIDALRPRIETLLSDKFHAQLSIGKLSPHWVGFQPGVEIDGLSVHNRRGQLALQVPHASATLSWRSLLQFKPLLASLVIEHPDLLAERAADGTLSVAGIALPNAHNGDSTFTDWLLSQQAIVLSDGTLRWRDALHPAPELALRHIRVAVLNDRYLHRLALQAPAEGTVLRGPLDFRARFTHAPLAALGKPANWKGEAYVSTGPVDLPTLARYVKLPITTYAGRVDNAIWIDFAGGHMTAAHGRLAGNDVSLRVRATQPRIDLPHTYFGWSVQAHDGDYTLRLRHLRAELGQPPLADGTPLTRLLALDTFTGRYRKPVPGRYGQLVSLSGDRVDLGILAEFSRALPLPPHLLGELVRFDPRGLVANYAIEVERAPPSAHPAPGEPSADREPVLHYRVKGDLQGISLAAQEPPPGLTPLNHPRAGLPGFENLWGSVDADERRGRVALDTASAAITLPGLFDNPRLRFDRIYGNASWTVAPQVAPGERFKAFKVDVARFGVANRHVQANLSAGYSNPGHGRGSLDLKAHFPYLEAARIARYLPTSINERTRNFFEHGLQGGVSRGATIEVHGGLDQFPYSHGPAQGIFRIVAPFRDGRFDPTPFPPRRLKDGSPDVWPALEGIDGVFELKEKILRFDLAHAHYRRFALSNIKGSIDDLGTRGSDLVVDGHGRGPLADLLAYIDASALGSMSKHAGARLQTSGNTELALKLTIPRVPHPRVGVNGTLAFLDNRVTWAGAPPVSQLRGKVGFTRDTLELNRLTGRFMGGPVAATGGLRPDGRYTLDLNGQIAMDEARQFDTHGEAAQLLGYLRGSAPYALTMRGRRGQLPEVEANSDLTGLALDFPAPFNKPAGQPMPLRFALRPAETATRETAASAGAQASAVTPTTGLPGRAGETDLRQADLQFGPLAARYILRRAPNRPIEVQRGALGIDAPLQLPASGVTAAVDLAAFDGDAWRALANHLHETVERTQARLPQDVAAQFLPDRLGVRVGALTLLDRQWDDLAVNATRSVRGGWQADLRAKQAAGHLDWQPGPTPDAPGRLQARLAKLDIPSSADNHLLNQAVSTPSRNMPAIDLIVDQLIVRERDFGRLQIDARNTLEDGVPVWRLDRFDISNPAATLAATANWRASRRLGTRADEDTPRRTVLDFRLDIKNAGALLARLGLPRTLKKGEGTLTGKLGWRGAPTAIDYPSLNGELALDLRHGQILKVDPGVAKLLGVLSLQSLARLSALNFRDVIGEGLPFESAAGHGRVSNGVGSTQDFSIKTAPARATMRGTVDLARETQDLHVHVVPTVGAGAAVVAVAVVNPFLGLGALLANVALSHSISSAFAFDYAITGSWSQPHIERVPAAQGKIDVQAPTTRQAIAP